MKTSFFLLLSLICFFGFPINANSNIHSSKNSCLNLSFRMAVINPANRISYATDFIDQDRTETAFNNMMNELSRVHKAIYSLPYDYEYIKNTIMAQVETKKLEIAPHFPNRANYGDDSTLGRQLFKEWYITYPGESSAYIAYADQLILEHSN